MNKTISLFNIKQEEKEKLGIAKKGEKKTRKQGNTRPTYKRI